MANANSTRAAEAPKDAACVLERVEALLNQKASLAWRVYNTLAFMVEAVPYDDPEDPRGLPVHCTLIDLKADMDNLATSLGALVHEARHE
ncbi:hypothetical protein [Paraburkholderia sp. J63]|uniref:hypothetical protein n=1 Tax=Paraburkholderia sp. J63 TaxID=2805434 RepID=UPI002ABD15C2|nr:hypothetical protein [Paraburkholderia sp. J63]